MNIARAIIAEGIRVWKRDHEYLILSERVNVSAHIAEREDSFVSAFNIRMTYKPWYGYLQDAPLVLTRKLSMEELDKARFSVEYVRMFLSEMLTELSETKTSNKNAENKKTDNDIFLKMAKAAVVCWYNNHNSRRIDLDDAYIVWFCKALQNWKVLAATHHEDGMYYEVTFDGNKCVAYVDAYRKLENVTMTHDLLLNTIEVKERRTK